MQTVSSLCLICSVSGNPSRPGHNPKPDPQLARALLHFLTRKNSRFFITVSIMFNVLRVKTKLKRNRRNGRKGQASKTLNSKFRKGKYKIKSFLVFLPKHKAKALESEPEPGPRPDPEPEHRQDKIGKDLSDDQVSSMKEAFTLFDTDGDGKIAPTELGILMRSLGGNPTQAQLKAIVAQEKLTAPFDFTQFLDLMRRHMKAEPFERQLRDAFKVLDKESTGFVLVSDLRHILTSVGEKLEPSEFDEWIREVDVGSDGKLCYEEFITRMVAN